MQLKYLAHAAFLLNSQQGTKLLTDPYESGSFKGAIAYKPIEEQVDIITISHEHVDHNYITPQHKSATVINKPGAHEVADITIKGFQVFHDTTQGKERGENIIFIINIDGLNICHLGDLGHTLSTNILQNIGEIDVLLLPVGGVFTVDADTATTVMEAIKPKICIPMHYKTDKLAFNLAPVSNFINHKNNVKKINNSVIELTKDNLPQTTEIWVLDFAQ